MPVFTVVLQLNVPGLGARTVTQANITAPTIADAISQAIQTVTIECTQVQKTGP
jgi:hypothetical protein